MNNIEGRKIWIIGASSGIGAALAAELSRRGAGLTISARRKEELEKVAGTLRHPARIAALDVSDIASMREAARSHGPFDSVLFMAAAYNPGLIEDIKIDDARRVVDINLNGAINMIDAVYPAMRQEKGGQIVLCGSVAGYCGLPNGQPYSMTKAAIINLAQSLKVEAVRHNVDVKLISPGFVRTPLTDKNDFNMPMMVEAADAARIIADGLVKPGFEIHFPRKFTCMVKLLSILPYGIYFGITRKILKSR